MIPATSAGPRISSSHIQENDGDPDGTTRSDGKTVMPMIARERASALAGT